MIQISWCINLTVPYWLCATRYLHHVTCVHCNSNYLWNALSPWKLAKPIIFFHHLYVQYRTLFTHGNKPQLPNQSSTGRKKARLGIYIVEWGLHCWQHIIIIKTKESCLHSKLVFCLSDTCSLEPPPPPREWPWQRILYLFLSLHSLSASWNHITLLSLIYSSTQSFHFTGGCPLAFIASTYSCIFSSRIQSVALFQCAQTITGC